ncbi:BhlA/UviB family holin-like peptide [Clostridium sp. FP2]
MCFPNISELADKFNIIENVKKNVEEIKKHMLKNNYK